MYSCKQPTDNQQITTTKEYKKERIEEYTHTLVDTKKGVVGGKEGCYDNFRPCKADVSGRGDEYCCLSQRTGAVSAEFL